MTPWDQQLVSVLNMNNVGDLFSQVENTQCIGQSLFGARKLVLCMEVAFL